jgi:hypothetical protein
MFSGFKPERPIDPPPHDRYGRPRKQGDPKQGDPK